MELRVRNAGGVVDAFTMTVLGAAAEWASIEPAMVSLFPGAEETVRVVFRPPRSADVAAGDVPFGVRVASREDTAGTVTEEGVVTVEPFAVVGIEVVPRTSRGSRRMEHEVAVSNHGNLAAEVSLRAVDPDDGLVFAFDPPSVAVAAGAAAFSKVKVRPRKTFGSGPPQTRTFQVVAEAGGQPVAVADAMAVQEATRPPWLRRAIVWSLIGLVALVALWFGLLKPAVRSAAKEAAQESVTPPTIGPGGGGSGSGSGSGASSGDASSSAGGGAVAAAGAGTPIDGRLFVTEPGSTDFTVPDGTTLQLTDIVLQNPAGNTGTLRVQRGDTALLVVELGNFRDLDYHFVAPIVFTTGQKLVLSADCTSPGCTPGAYFAGFLVRG